MGCKLNFSETSTIARSFAEKGYRRVEFHERPDIFIINTCSVTDNADKRCRKIVREAQQISPDAYIAIIGCYAQLKPKEIAEIPGVDAVLGAAEKFRLHELLDDFVKPESAKVIAQEISATNEFNTSYSIHDRTRTFLKVQDGCNYNCSFCTIPLARGKSRSDTIANIVEQAKAIGNTEVKEIVLTGVNTGDFGIQNGRRKERFLDLIKALDEIKTIDRFRISSIEPNLLSEEIIDFVSKSQRFVPHFHVPMQSGSDNILKLMRRRYRKALYQGRVASIKRKMPNCAIGVDVIVGFPGETEKDFLETYNFLNELDVSYLHVFTYSERSNTPAAAMDGVVPIKERNRRSKMLRTLSEKKKRHFYEKNLHTLTRVLFENDVQDGKIEGFTENYIRVVTKYDPALVNECKDLKLVNINRDGLVEVVEPELVTA